MKPGVFSVLALTAAIQWVAAAADPRANPYGQIVDRNVFGLKPPPPPQVEAPKEEVKPPPNVKLTGISNLAQKRAFIEVSEQAPKAGQPPGTVNRPILSEGEAAFGVEVLAIDVEKNIVKIRNAGIESELTFEVVKSPGGATAATGTPQPGVHQPNYGAPGAVTQPGVGGANPQQGGGPGVTIYGGASTSATNNYGVTTLGGTQPGIPSPLGADAGTMRTIPARTIRTPPTTDPQSADAAQQAALAELNRAAAAKYRGRQMPPSPVPPGFQGDVLQQPQNPPPPLPQQ
jgi:hypothetical protein